MAAKIVTCAHPGHQLTRPTVWRAPFIFASPHSGRDYPAPFLADTVLSLDELRRSEDAYVDALLPSAEILGIPVLAARFPRAFVDVNRDPRELDPTMFVTPPADGGEVRSNRVLAGFGAIPKFAAEGRAIYARKLTAAEGKARLENCYAPYHEALAGLIEEARSVFGEAIVIDWHSMPSASVTGRALADVVLGDRYGSSCHESVIAGWEAAFSRKGLSVARNSPYAGGHVTTVYGQPTKGVQALQIELNRGRYLDETRVARRPRAFEALRDQIAGICEDVLGAASSNRIAAE